MSSSRRRLYVILRRSKPQPLWSLEQKTSLDRMTSSLRESDRSAFVVAHDELMRGKRKLVGGDLSATAAKRVAKETWLNSEQIGLQAVWALSFLQQHRRPNAPPALAVSTHAHCV
jgi:hypothetical protein